MTNETVFIIETVVKSVILLIIIASIAGFATYVERKILGFMHRRLGPTYVGPFGLLQALADVIKLFTKEDIVPQNSVKVIFYIAPLLIVTAVFTAFAAVPFFPEFEIYGHKTSAIISDVNVGILFVVGVASAGMYAPLLAGLSSANKWSLLGGARAVVQLLSFEVITALAILAPIMLIGSLSLVDINNFQNGGLFNWLIWQQPVAFVLFCIAGFAETNRTPFDLLEQESEIVSGYITEYSGMRWALFFLGEYSNMMLISFLVALMFLGGFNSLWVIPGSVMMLLKVLGFMFFFMWARGAWPHIRPDQLMWLCWKVLLPIALLNVLVTGTLLLLGE
ncbi:MAG: NADH-quinone oxidoreductase subunit NuoH [Campylobacteraceae bacterium]|jgi:NADH-quinone oxidoreductase subunit H|nr:NADH-quinone oxidoreductase subunit NuoH [Campylobacteraceae bacterium]